MEPLIMTIEAVYPAENGGSTVEGHIQQGMLTLGQAIKLETPGETPLKSENWHFIGFIKSANDSPSRDNLIVLIEDIPVQQLQKGMVIRQPTLTSENSALLFAKRFEFIVPLSIEGCQARVINLADVHIVAQNQHEVLFMKSPRKSYVCAITTLSSNSPTFSRIAGRAGIRWIELRRILLLDTALIGIVFVLSAQHIEATIILAGILILLPVLLELTTVYTVISGLKRDLGA